MPLPLPIKLKVVINNDSILTKSNRKSIKKTCIYNLSYELLLIIILKFKRKVVLWNIEKYILG